MECQDPAQILRPCFPCKFCNQQYFYSQASLCEHEINDHGYVRPATVTTAKIAPTFSESSTSSRGEDEHESWYSVAETGVSEPYWAQWTKENEGYFRDYVLNIRTARSIHLQDTGLSFLDFVPDYSASNFPKSLFTKLDGDISRVNEAADNTSIETPTGHPAFHVLETNSEICNHVDANERVDASNFCCRSNAGMEMDSEILSHCDSPVENEQLLEEGPSPSRLEFEHPDTSFDHVMINSESETLVTSVSHEHVNLYFATEEEMPAVEQFFCEDILQETLYIPAELQGKNYNSSPSKNIGIPQTSKKESYPHKSGKLSSRGSTVTSSSRDSSRHGQELDGPAPNELNEHSVQEQAMVNVSRNDSSECAQTKSLERVDYRIKSEPISETHSSLRSRQQTVSNKNKSAKTIPECRSPSLVNRASNLKPLKSKSTPTRKMPKRSVRRLEKIGRTRSQTQNLGPNKVAPLTGKISPTRRR